MSEICFLDQRYDAKSRSVLYDGEIGSKKDAPASRLPVASASLLRSKFRESGRSYLDQAIGFWEGGYFYREGARIQEVHRSKDLRKVDSLWTFDRNDSMDHVVNILKESVGRRSNEPLRACRVLVRYRNGALHTSRRLFPHSGRWVLLWK